MLKKDKSSVVRSAFGSLAALVPPVALMSCIINVLALTGSFYMLQVYDRVLSSRSVPTLVAFSALVVLLYTFQGLLEAVRGQVFTRLAARVDRNLSAKAYEIASRLPLYGGSRAEALQPLRDADTIRAFLASQGPIAIFDVPWMPLYLAFVFLLHPMLGLLTVAGVLVMVALALLSETRIRQPSQSATQAATERHSIAQTAERNAEAIRAMGFSQNLQRRFTAANERHLKSQESLGDVSGMLSVTGKVFRMFLQSALLGTGAYLAIHGDMSAGSIIAVSIASARALAPIESAIANWKGFVASRQAAARFDKVMEALPKEVAPLQLPRPSKSVTLEAVSVAIPGTQRFVLNNVSMEIKAGSAVAIIGPSAAGKSSLARSLVGIWPAARGSVRIDGAAVERWSNADLGRYVGYMPQEVELFEGTITDNISRFAENPESTAVLQAAQAADVHEMILRLPQGYETRIGDRGTSLSAGQRQRIGLARALYGNPFLVVLDEPNSNLDADGDAALLKAINGVKDRGGIAVIVAHRPAVLQAVDLVAVVGNGQLTAFGPRDEVIRRATKQPAPTAGSNVTALDRA